MRNIFLVAKREFSTQVKKKSFVILTILTPLLLIGFGWVISYMFQANKSEYTISVVDRSGFFQNKLKSDESLAYIFVPENAESQLKQNLKQNQDTDGLLAIPNTKNHQEIEKGVSLFTNKNIGFEVRKRISDDLSEIIKVNKIKDLGVGLAQIQDLDKVVSLNIINVSGEKEDDILVGVKSGLSVFLTYIIFSFIFMYGVRVMRSVLEEKSNRVVEILISSVKPFDLMMGKILGVTVVAFLQFSIWVIMILISYQVLGSPSSGIMANANEDIKNIFSLLSQIDYGMMLFAFVGYFILGYLFYSSIYAAIGSAVDSETESQQFSILAVIPLLLGFYGSMTIFNNPDGDVGFWLSMIPFTSPIAMLARIPFGVSVWELVLSMSILLISVLGMIFLASKIYRIGILMYGNKITYKDLWKWLKED